MSSRRTAILAFVVAVLLAIPSSPGLAQPVPGKISGTLRDAQGNPVPGANITVTNQQTGATKTVRSNETGGFEAGDLAPGLYTVSADPQGFLRVTRHDLRVAEGATLNLDLALEVRIAEEVTVTAMKREDTVHNVPFSVVAPTEEDLQQKGVDNVEELAANIGNFSVQNLGPGQSQVSMRGVSSGQIARDQPGPKEEVGTYLDESVISFLLFTPDIDLFDMNRVEVLRGPQGTLYGSGSLSGTVRYISNQPEPNKTSFFGELTGTAIDGGSQGGEVKAGFNAPLGSQAALRMAAYFDHSAGFMDAVQPGGGLDTNVNDSDRAGVRAAVAITPDENVTITPRFMYQRLKAHGWNRHDAYNILANPFTTTRPDVSLQDDQLFTQIEEPMTDNFYLGDINANIKLGGNTSLTSITSFTYRDILVVRDAGALTSSITGGSIGLPEDVYTLNAPLDDATKARAWTQELRLAGGNDRINWVGGGYYAHIDKHYGQNLFVNGFEDLSGIPTQGLRAPKDVLFYSDLHYTTRQFAFFGEGTLNVTPWFRFTAGLRYYNFKDDKDQIFDGIFGNDNNGTSLVSNPGTTKADGVAPRFIASFSAGDTIINAQVSKGFRLGGINDPLNVPLCSPSDLVTFGGRNGFEDETAWNYEIGSKSRLFNGRAYVNASAFYIDIQNLQAVVTAGTCSSRLVFSVPKARSVGGELEFGAVANEHFDFNASLGYNDATLRSTITSTDANGNVSIISGIQTGARLPSVPKFQAAVSATYQQPVMEGVQGYLTGTYQHVGSRFTQVGDDVAGFGVVPLQNLPGALPHTIGGPLTQDTFVFDPELPAYDLFNFRLGARFGNLDIAFYVNNATNERALLALDRERGLLARVGFLVNQPRTFGLTTRAFF
jgi:iron complex outermembrane receptor protein